MSWQELVRGIAWVGLLAGILACVMIMMWYIVSSLMG